MATSSLISTRTFAPGDIVVPFSEIADILRARLSSVELNQLLNQLISQRVLTPQPGDLITAEWAIDVQNRLSLLEGGGKGPLNAVNIKAAETLLDTAEAYSRLISRQRIFPDGADNNAIKGALAVTNGFQRVQILAMSSISLPMTADRSGLLGIFERLYDAQHDLAVMLSSPLTGFSSGGSRLLFATQLNGLLETNDGVTGALSLHNALAAKNVEAAVAAQDRINGITFSESGEAIVGNLEVAYRGSTRGETLVLNDAQPFGYIFRVTNKTNRSLNVQLQPDFAPPRQPWNTSIAIVGGAGRQLALKPFDPANVDDSGAFQDVQVNVLTPAGASLGDQGVLGLHAAVPPPVGVAANGSVALSIGNAASAPAQSFVRFTPETPITENGSISNAAEDMDIGLRFDFTFVANVDPRARDFMFEFEGDADFDNKFFVDFVSPIKINQSASTAKLKRSTAFSVAENVPRSVKVQIIPLAGSSRTSLGVTARVIAVDDRSISGSKSFSVVVR